MAAKKIEERVLTQQRLRDVLAYSPETGLFTWVVSLGNKGLEGAVAGYICAQGYRMICVDQREYRAARLAFFWMTGRWPDQFVDHIDGDRANDRWANLRPASFSQNAANAKRRHDQQHAKGVSQIKKTGRWVASIHLNNRKIHLGCFATSEAAAAAYAAAAREAFGQFARTA